MRSKRKQTKSEGDQSSPQVNPSETQFHLIDELDETPMVVLEDSGDHYPILSVESHSTITLANDIVHLALRVYFFFLSLFSFSDFHSIFNFFLMSHINLTGTELMKRIAWFESQIA